MGRLRFTTVLGGGDEFAYRREWLHTIYVSTTGNDTTGNGTKLTPYRTLVKALTVAVAGDGILFANGTYAEGTAGSYLNLTNKNYANWVTIEPENGKYGTVIITGNGNATYETYCAGTTSYFKFRYITFLAATATTLFRMDGVANMQFDYCTFDCDGVASRGLYCAIASNVQFNNCIIGTDSLAYGVYCTTGTLSNLQFLNCKISGANTGSVPAFYFVSTTATDEGLVSGGSITGGCAVLANGGDVTISNVTLTATNTGNSVQFGFDGESGNATTGSISNCTIVKNPALSGHTCIIGAGCTGVVVDNIAIAQSYDYGIVVKENTGTEVSSCSVVGGSASALYFKAAVSANAHNNTLTGNGATAGAFQTNVGGTGNKCQNWQFQNNVVNVNVGKALKIAGDAGDLGGGICDYNTYENNSGLGAVRSDADVQSLAELQAAWADYDVTTNDAHSTVI